MRLKVALDKIKPGTRFTADVFTDDSNLFVPAGVPVRKKDIDGLMQWNIQYVYTDGVMQSDEPEKKDINKNVETITKSGLAVVVDKEVNAEFQNMVAKLKSVMDSIAVSEAVEPKKIDDIAQSIVKYMRDDPNPLIDIVLSSDFSDYNWAKSAVSCSVLSVLVGIIMKLPAYRLNYLAQGALIHDVGMLRIPSEIVEKKTSLDAEEKQKMKSHPLLSYKIIVNELRYPEEVGLIAVQHHERWDGEGYPRKLSGQDINVLARIVSVADAFEAMLSEKPYREPLIAYLAIKNLLADNSRRFDPEVLKAFVKSLGIYPIGSIVVLNNAAIGRVIATSAEVPLRPKIRIIVDEFGNHYKNDSGDVVDLLSEKTLFIARALDPKELNG